MNAEDLARLAEPFPIGELSWRIVQSGKNDRGLWAKCAPYVDARAVMKRLDEVCGPANWQTATRPTEHHVAYGIGIRIGDEWIWRWDGTGVKESGGGMSSADAGKADFSYGVRRAGIQWGLGRYLYDVPHIWANINDNGRFRQPKNERKKLPAFNWDPGQLPDFALPGEPEIVGEVRKLLKKAGALGLGGGDDEAEAKGIEAAEAAISRQDSSMLARAKGWLEDEVEKRERAELEKTKKQLGGDNQKEPAGAGAQAELPY